LTGLTHGRSSSALPDEQDKRAVVEAMFDRIAGDYERVNRVISLGFDRRWRRRVVESLELRSGAVVMDMACGTGDLCRVLQAGGYHAVGIDFSAGMLSRAKNTAALVRADVCMLPVRDAAADGVTCGFALRNLVDLSSFFTECARVLRPGGRLAVIDAAIPENAVARAGHRVWFGLLVPWLGARMSEPAAYKYLAASTAYLPATEEFAAVVARAGFDDVRLSALMWGAVKLLIATKP
jgi:demethylmenaquinone methyltransferase/2-methoxy-6-polyprenyl-1,4-benzoquinol methylase